MEQPLVSRWTAATAEGSQLAELQEALAARDALILEMDHRIKNHLQILASYARTLAGRAGVTGRDVADDMRLRLATIASVHDALYAAGRRGYLPAHELVLKVCEPFAASEHALRVLCDADLELPAAHATPLGMILTEAICNSIKHGFADGRAGEIEVGLRRAGDRIVLQVSDDGDGFAPIDERRSGVRLMEALARQLGAYITFGVSDCGGAAVRVAVPRPC